MGKYLDIAKKFDHRLREQRDPVSPVHPAATSRPPSASRPFVDDARETLPDSTAWPCPRCGHPATIEDVSPSLDGARTLTLWSCEPCQVVAVTPDAIRTPPMNWIKLTHQ